MANFIIYFFLLFYQATLFNKANYVFGAIILIKNWERSFVATPISLLHDLYQIFFTKSLGLVPTVSSKTNGPTISVLPAPFLTTTSV